MIILVLGKPQMLMAPAQGQRPAQDWDCLAETPQYPAVTVSALSHADQQSGD